MTIWWHNGDDENCPRRRGSTAAEGEIPFWWLRENNKIFGCAILKFTFGALNCRHVRCGYAASDNPVQKRQTVKQQPIHSNANCGGVCIKSTGNIQIVTVAAQKTHRIAFKHAWSRQHMATYCRTNVGVAQNSQKTQTKKWATRMKSAGHIFCRKTCLSKRYIERVWWMDRRSNAHAVAIDSSSSMKSRFGAPARTRGTLRDVRSGASGQGSVKSKKTHVSRTSSHSVWSAAVMNCTCNNVKMKHKVVMTVFKKEKGEMWDTSGEQPTQGGHR